MTTIFFKRQENRKKEVAFFHFLRQQLGFVQHINENYPLPHILLTECLEIPKVVSALRKDKKLSTSKRLQTLEALKILPSKVLVAESISEVSVDFTIIKNNTAYFIEFHEKQHSKLCIKRQTPIFTPKPERFEIPRYAQRFLKDVWRWQTLQNYKIVWWDWFEENKDSFGVDKLLTKGNTEFYQKDKFCFSNF